MGDCGSRLVACEGDFAQFGGGTCPAAWRREGGGRDGEELELDGRLRCSGGGWRERGRGGGLKTGACGGGERGICGFMRAIECSSSSLCSATCQPARVCVSVSELYQLQVLTLLLPELHTAAASGKCLVVLFRSTIDFTILQG
jgi:hypothetical protein